MDVIKLTEEWGVEVVLCSNLETLDVNNDADKDFVTQANREASEVIWDALGGFPDQDGFFANWHAGKYTPNCDSIYTCFFKRENAVDEDGEIEEGEWEYVWDGGVERDYQRVAMESIPVDLRKRVEAAVEAAAEARNTVLVHWVDERY